jgi:glycosyltransferase involved in cell wall biosynthesis
MFGGIILKIVNLNPDIDPGGVGWTLCKILKKHEGHDTFHIVGNRHYQMYMTNFHLQTSMMDPEAMEEIFDKADVIHINQWWPSFVFRGKEFNPVLQRNKDKLILEFHGAPELDLSKHPYVMDYYNKGIPVVIIHPHYFKWLPKAIIPAITTPVETDSWIPNWREKRPPYKLGKSSSSGEKKNVNEWHELCMIRDIEEFLIYFKTHTECLRIKRDIIDMGHDSYDLGYVNISAFENACFGVPTFSSGKSEMALYKERDPTGGVPFENVENNDEAVKIIKEWLRDPDLINNRSREIRIWMEKYWNEKDCARIWTEIYEKHVPYLNGGRVKNV